MAKTKTQNSRSKSKLDKLGEFVLEEFPKIKHLVIERFGEEHYLLFDAYTLKKAGDGWIVSLGERSATLSSLPTATAWAILHNSGEYLAATHIETYDAKVSQYGTDMANLSRLKRTSKDSFVKDCADAKWSEVKYRSSQASTMLRKYLTLAKYRQTKGFVNETARPLSQKYIKKSS